jgi:hypothetical protein
MGFFAAVKNIFGSDASAAEAVVDQIMREHRLRNIQAIIEAARSWKPALEFSTYDEEIDNRVDYYLGNMQDDMADELERCFPQAHLRMEDDQLNMRFITWRTRKLARVFKKPGEVVLLDKAKNRVPSTHPSMVALKELLDESNFWYAAKDADRYATLCQRCAVKVWWDERNRRVQFAIWAPSQADVLVNPDFYWSVDDAYAVGFRRPGAGGLGHEQMEIWANLPDGQALHFVTEQTKDVQINEGDVNPFRDPAALGEDGQPLPLYPFIWLQEDAINQLYHIANCDLLRANRALNMHLTDASYSQRFQGHSVLKLTSGEENRAKMPSVLAVGPDDVLVLPAGWEGDFISPDPMTEQNLAFARMIMQAQAQVDGIDPKVLAETGSGGAESGVAIKLKNMDVSEYIDDKKIVYRRQFEDLVRRACIVRDYYAEAAGKTRINLYENGFTVSLNFAASDDPVDQAETIDNHIKMIGQNVATAVDLRMTIYAETREAAEAAVLKNKAYNATNQPAAPAGQNVNDILQGWRDNTPRAKAAAAEQGQQEEEDEGQPEIVKQAAGKPKVAE